MIAAPNTSSISALGCTKSITNEYSTSRSYFYIFPFRPENSLGGQSPPPQRATPRPFPPPATSTAPSRQCSALRPRSSRQFPSLFVLLYVSFAIRPHRAVDAFNSARSLSPSCARSSAPSLRRIRLHRPFGYATIGSRQSSALQRFADRVLCIG